MRYAWRLEVFGAVQGVIDVSTMDSQNVKAQDLRMAI
jgi:hypothetical protein